MFTFMARHINASTKIYVMGKPFPFLSEDMAIYYTFQTLFRRYKFCSVTGNISQDIPYDASLFVDPREESACHFSGEKPAAAPARVLMPNTLTPSSEKSINPACVNFQLAHDVWNSLL
jgi:hypothetical protein